MVNRKGSRKKDDIESAAPTAASTAAPTGAAAAAGADAAGAARSSGGVAAEPAQDGGAAALPGAERSTVGLSPVGLSDDARAVALREALLEAGAAGSVGDLVDVVAEGAGVVTARFAATAVGYVGWQWSVTVALTDPARPTVSEVVLLPGPDALLAPEWVPWKQRVRSGDLGVGDLLPPAPDDARIVPAYLESDDPAVEDLAHEVGVGRVRVLSRVGRTEAATRWHAGSFGPDDEMAKHAPGHCATCAFFVPLAGSLGAGFGACTNVFSPADGHVVDVRYGCGAHSEAAFRPRAAQSGDTVVDELRLEVHRRSAEAAEEAEIDGAGGALAGPDPDGDAGVDDRHPGTHGAMLIDDTALAGDELFSGDALFSRDALLADAPQVSGDDDAPAAGTDVRRRGRRRGVRGDTAGGRGDSDAGAGETRSDPDDLAADAHDRPDEVTP